MARYIDADELIFIGIDNPDDDNLFEFVPKEFIDNAPTADVKPIIKGFWYALEKGDKGYSAGDFKCSICGEPNHTWLPKPNYCPNCGARMEAEE